MTLIEIINLSINPKFIGLLFWTIFIFVVGITVGLELKNKEHIVEFNKTQKKK